MMPPDLLAVLKPHYERALAGQSGTIEHHSVRTGLDFTIDAAPVGMAQIDLNGQFATVNNALCELVGYTAEQLCAMRYESIVHPDAHERIIDTLQTMIEVESPNWTSEGRLIHADGRIVWVSQSTTVVRDSTGRPTHFLAHYQDITDRKQFDSQLKHLAEHDSLTGLQNRW